MQEVNLSQKTFAFDWELKASARETIQELGELGSFRPGICLAEPGGKVVFYDEETLISRAANADTGERFKPLLDLFNKAKAVKDSAYDPASDSILAFDQVMIPEQLSNKKSATVRAWWLRPMRRGVKRINLDEPQRMIDHLAFMG